MPTLGKRVLLRRYTLSIPIVATDRYFLIVKAISNGKYIKMERAVLRHFAPKQIAYSD